MQADDASEGLRFCMFPQTDHITQMQVQAPSMCLSHAQLVQLLRNSALDNQAVDQSTVSKATCIPFFLKTCMPGMSTAAAEVEAVELRVAGLNLVK